MRALKSSGQREKERLTSQRTPATRQIHLVAKMFSLKPEEIRSRASPSPKSATHAEYPDDLAFGVEVQHHAILNLAGVHGCASRCTMRSDSTLCRPWSTSCANFSTPTAKPQWIDPLQSRHL